MLLPIKWLEDYVKVDESAKIIADEITATGSHVESIEDRSEGLKKIVIGKILEIKGHPDADKLVVCQVDVGEEVLQIVTAATNVFEGAIVPVALVGAHLADGTKIKKGKLRGVESKGMFCSLEEVGYDNSIISKEAKDGIFIINEDIELGTSFVEALNLQYEIIELEITPNRSDCLSIIGMARETAATFKKELKEPEIVIKEESEDIKDYFNSIEIESENCNRFYARVLKEVEIKESPLWLQNYITSCGIRPVNNIVDLTNFVMLEYGQPLHAYDLDDLKSKKIVVRQANNGEKLTTLDEQERELKEEDILITDGENIIGLAGVMGGLDSEVKKETKTILLEGASFNDKNIRKTSKRLQLRTDASSRFEKCVDSNFASIAVDRVCQLAEEIGAAKVVGGKIDNHPVKRVESKVKLREEKCNNLIGINISIEEMAEILNSLEISTEIQGKELIATIPTFRFDIEIEEDLIEEVARIYGYHNIEPKPLEGSITVGGKSKLRNLEDRVKKVLLSLGCSEFMTYSFVSPSNFDKLNISEDNKLRDVIKLINPLGEEYSIMRTTLVSNMLEALSKNEHRGNKNVAGFEFGNTFIPQGEDLPKEEHKLSIGFYDIGDFYYLKELIEKALWSIGVSDLVYKRAEVEYLHPGRSAEIYLGDEYIGLLGEVHPNVLKNYEMKKKVYIAELDFERLVKHSIENYKYKAVPKYPAMKRDLAIVIDKDVDAYEIEAIAKENGKKLLESFNVFDIYTGESIGEEKKSVAFSMTFRAKDRTLVEAEINDIVSSVISDLENKIDAHLRS